MDVARYNFLPALRTKKLDTYTVYIACTSKDLCISLGAQNFERLHQNSSIHFIKFCIYILVYVMDMMIAALKLTCAFCKFSIGYLIHCHDRVIQTTLIDLKTAL
jgi:hypothetical protein